ncbi:MAG: hypothetical protein Q8920_08545 [Bacillota bacterium]|nr:hypothetical protein [Bacillota bacterium]
MKETVNTILTTVVIPLAGVLTTYLVNLLRKKSKEITHNINNANVNKYVNIAEDAICTAVTAISQTYVDALKKKGTFDQAAKDESFILAKQKALAIMGEGAQVALKELYTDFDTWLDSKIEYYVNIGKTVKPTVNNTTYQVPQITSSTQNTEDVQNANQIPDTNASTPDVTDNNVSGNTCSETNSPVCTATA